MGAFFDCFVDVGEVGAETGYWVDDTGSIGPVLYRELIRRCPEQLDGLGEGRSGGMRFELGFGY